MILAFPAVGFIIVGAMATLFPLRRFWHFAVLSAAFTLVAWLLLVSCLGGTQEVDLHRLTDLGYLATVLTWEAIPWFIVASVPFWVGYLCTVLLRRRFYTAVHTAWFLSSHSGYENR